MGGSITMRYTAQAEARYTRSAEVRIHIFKEIVSFAGHGRVRYEAVYRLRRDGIN